MWLSKPLYESVPYYYIVAGLVALLSSLYVNYWYWPVICLVTGFGCLIAGLVVWLKRRDYRQHQSQRENTRDEL